MKFVKREICALNVRVHPHTPDTYVELFSLLYKSRGQAKVWGDREGVIRTFDRKPDRDGRFYGTISTFTEIDLDQPWFNDETFDVSSFDEVEEIMIPDHLHPNVHSFLFCLDSQKHLVFIEKYGQSGTMTPMSAMRFFQNICSRNNVTNRFGPVKISLVQSREALDAVFSLDQIKRVEILIQKPNDIFPDDFEEHLNRKNAKSIEVKYKAENRSGIEVDDEIRSLSEASLLNGKTVVTGRDDTGQRTISTENYPKIVQDKFPVDATDRDMFSNLVERFHDE